MAFTTRPGPNDNGILDVNVVGNINNVKVNIVSHLDNSPGVEDNHSGPFKQQLDKNLGEVIPTMISNLKDKLSGSGQFVFPGIGVFDFVNPMMSRYGHLLAQVKYKVYVEEKCFLDIRRLTGTEYLRKRCSFPASQKSGSRWWWILPPRLP